MGDKILNGFMENLEKVFRKQKLQVEEDMRYKLAAINEGERLYYKWLDTPSIKINGKECKFFMPTINPCLMGKRTYDAEIEKDIDFKEIALNEMERLISETQKRNQNE